jgi:hypothetical protein
MKTRTLWILSSVIVIVAVLAAGCATGPLSGNPGAGPGQGSGAGQGNGPAQAGGQGAGTGQAAGLGAGGVSPSLLPQADASPLSATETADILFLREEEQLAHDLYTRWAAQYAVPVFSTIAGSETTHYTEVQLLIDRYGIPGRVGNASAGYTEPAIQALYDDLGPKGDASLAGAFEGGLAVEERDIADIDRMAANTTRTDIAQVYANLRQGSENHRSAFLRQLGR